MSRKAENFYRRDPMKALHGMIGLSMDEKATYNTMLDLLYSSWKPLRDQDKDDRKFIANWVGCAPQKLNPIIASLIAKGRIIRVKIAGKLYLSDEAFEAERVNVKGGEASEKHEEVEEKSDRSPGEVREKSEEVGENCPLLDTDNEENQQVAALEKRRVEKKRKEDDDSKREALDPIFIDANGWASDSKWWVADILEQIPDLIPPSNIAVLTGWRDVDRFEWVDVIMGIKVTMSRKGYDPPRSWKYFAPAIQEAKNDRTTPTPERKSNGNGTHHAKPHTGRSVAGLAAAIADANKGRFS